MKTVYDLVVILGATASGKTALAVKAARRFGGEIISADSRQVYQGMDLGTGKDLQEYGDVPCHLIDIAAAGSEYNLFRFQRDCYAAIEAIRERGRLPILCGGTGMYLDAVLRGYELAEAPPDPCLREELAGMTDAALRARLLSLKPEQHNRTDLDDRQRLIRACEIAIADTIGSGEPTVHLDLSPLVFGLRWPREQLRRRIAMRLQQRLKAGMIDEVRTLHDTGVSWQQLEFYGLEYRYIARYLQGELSRNDMVQKLGSAIGQFAKRQETFFRRMEKKGVVIHWLDAENDPFGELCRIAGEA